MPLREPLWGVVERRCRAGERLRRSLGASGFAATSGCAAWCVGLGVRGVRCVRGVGAQARHSRLRRVCRTPMLGVSIGGALVVERALAGVLCGMPARCGGLAGCWWCWRAAVGASARMAPDARGFGKRKPRAWRGGGWQGSGLSRGLPHEQRIGGQPERRPCQGACDPAAF